MAKRNGSLTFIYDDDDDDDDDDDVSNRDMSSKLTIKSSSISISLDLAIVLCTSLTGVVCLGIFFNGERCSSFDFFVVFVSLFGTIAEDFYSLGMTRKSFECVEFEYLHILIFKSCLCVVMNSE